MRWSTHQRARVMISVREIGPPRSASAAEAERTANSASSAARTNIFIGVEGGTG